MLFISGWPLLLLALLRGAFDQGKLSFHGKSAALADPRELAAGYNETPH